MSMKPCPNWKIFSIPAREIAENRPLGNAVGDAGGLRRLSKPAVGELVARSFVPRA
jgi:hypothetical protein